MSSLVKICVKLYQYVRIRKLNTEMTIEPNQVAVERELAGLGFTTRPVDLPGRDRLVKDSEIILDPKKDKKMLMGLAYYSDSLLQDIVMDSCVSNLLQKHFMKTQEPIKVERIAEEVSFIGQVLKNEYIDRNPMPFIDIIKERLALFASLGELKFN